ncbi:hypothetical protein [Halalkalibacter alkalisediminis]|uniref:YolD-like family protein n=1 Tax=Halalkalibacter alkalisediminis TaxID=935616 RepID=A0ABV6NAZ5_9BACI|nr:hypothetical protein [Halalkalibacter alkalisediminis]
MSKKTAPLLYIYQRKEADVEAINQEFIYKKFKVHVEAKSSVEKNEYILDHHFEEIATEKMTISEKLEYLITSPTDQGIKIEVDDEVYKGHIKEVKSNSIVIVTEEEQVQLNINEVTAVQIL